MRHKGDVLPLHRLEGLYDGVFAIAMTILVLDLIIPENASVDTQTELAGMLTSFIHIFINYCVAFIMLASFWLISIHQFKYFKETNEAHIWISLFMLLFICLMPFVTSFMGDFGGLVIAELMFHLDILIIGIFIWARWKLIESSPALLKDGADLNKIEKSKKLDLVLIWLPLIGMLIAIFLPELGASIYFLLPLWFSDKVVSKVGL